jgi:hypothetical protein
MRAVVLFLSIVLVTVSGCIGDGRPDACDSAEVTLNLTLTATELDPANVDVCRDQEVTLRIQAEADGIIHIHGYDEEVPATEVAAGEETELAFEAVRAGQYPIEFHPADDPAGVSVGIFTVHEP